MVSPESTFLTQRQVEVLELRNDGLTQAEAGEILGTTNANVSAIERAAEQNIEKARKTLELYRTLSTPVSFTLEEGSYFDELIDEIYRVGDEAGTKIDYSRPELYPHMFDLLEAHIDRNKICTTVEIGIDANGDVTVYPDEA